MEKKILILANYDLGLYKFRKELIQALINQGNEVHIALPYGELVEPLKKMGCQYIEIVLDRRGINPFSDLKLLLRYKKLLKTIQPQQVITYTIKPNIYGGLISRWLKVPYYTNITGLGTAFQGKGILIKLITVLYQQALKKAAYVFFENTANRDTFFQYQIIQPSQAVVLKGAGVNLNEYLFIPMSQAKKIRFLFIGRVMKEKGIEELFEVAKRIKKEYPEVAFDIVGPLEEDYSEQVKAFDEKGIIKYHGYQKDVRPFIIQCHCFVLPSYHEGMANTLLEAAAIGRPLITTDIPGCQEAINHNGYTVKVQDQEDLYKKIKQFIKLTRDEQVELGKYSRQHMEETFDKQKVVGITLKYLRE